MAMKKLILLLLVPAVLMGCSIEDDDSPNAALNVFVPIVSANLPDSLISGQDYSIELTYLRPTRCHVFEKIDFRVEQHEYFIGVINSFPPNDTACEEEADLTAEIDFSFTPEQNDFYIFNFWQGQNAKGQPEFLTIEVPLVNSGSAD